MSQGNRWDQTKTSDRHGAGAYGQSSDGAGTTGHLARFATGVITDNGNAFSYATDTGAANAYAVALSPAITLAAGDILYFKVGHTNTGASTLALNGGSAIAIKKRDGVTALAAGDWTAGQVVEVIYDGTNWQWTGFSGSALALQTNGSANSLQTLLDLVAGSGITLSNSSGHTTIAGTAATGSSGTYNLNFGILGLPAGGSVVLAFHVFTEAVSFAANFSGSRGGVPVGGVNATTAQTWTLNKIPSGSSTATAVGTVTISTAGVVAFTSASGATVSFAAGDTVTLVGSATADATLSYVDVVLQGLRATVTSTPIGVITFGWLGTVPASQIIGMYEFVNGMTFPANFSGAAYGKCLTNPTATWTATVQKNGSTVGTVSVSTSGVFTFTSSGGAAVSFVTGDLMTLVAQSSADSTFAYVAVSFSGSANGYVILGGDLGGTATAPKVIGLQGVGISATSPTNGQELVYNSTTGLWTPAAPSGGAAISSIQQEAYVYSADSGSANAYAVTLSPAPSIAAGSEAVFKAANANTGASTLSINGTSYPLKKNGTTALASGDIVSGQIISAKYDGTNFQMLVPGSSSGMTNPMTTAGDLIYGGSSGTPTRLAGGTSGDVLTSNGATSAPSWQASSGSSSAGPTVTSLTWGSAATLWQSSNTYASNQTFSGFKHLRVRLVLNRSSTSVSLGVHLSADAVHSYNFSAQSDGNLVWYYNSSLAAQTALVASATNNTNISGYTFLDIDWYPFAASKNMMKAWKDAYHITNNGTGTNNGATVSTHLDLTSGTFKIYVSIDSSANIVAAYVESW